MTNTTNNLRKAAVLLRSLDGETAATMLARLSPAEAAKLRDAIRTLGPIDTEEQADVVAEFRRITPLAAESRSDGVELSLTSTENRFDHVPSAASIPVASPKRFEFLESAPISALTPFLSNEHVQTIAVVLSHLRPERAAAMLAALTAKRQADVIERLAVIGDTDPESLTVVEHELAAWVQKRTCQTQASDRRKGAVTSILAAADAATRSAILANLRSHKTAALTEQITAASMTPRNRRRATFSNPARSHDRQCEPITPPPLRQLPPSFPIPASKPFRIEFDHLIELDDRALATVLRDVDANVLVLALAGSREDLIERICDQMPKRVAREFRRQLRRLGPTRLSDVETAQRAVADIAVQRLAQRRTPDRITSLTPAMPIV